MRASASPTEPFALRTAVPPRPGPGDDGGPDAAWSAPPDHRYRGRRLAIKRLIDIVVGVCLLIAASPVMAATAAAIRLSSPGPAIFRQRRVGRNGEPFIMLKYRTMRPDADARLRSDPALHARYVAGGYKLPLDDDPRITWFGAFLRRSSIDELPQLYNVLRGEMSLVGPRPVVPEELDQYQGYVEAYLMAVPGLTGLWQVSGRDAVGFPDRAQVDADYISDWSLRTDASILLRTIPAVALARGVR